jgi:hypothetical protein
MLEKDACEAGVAFVSLPGCDQPDFFNSYPCFGPTGTCLKAKYRTAEEKAAEEAELKARIEAIGKARKAIVEACGGPWERGKPSVGGECDCPVCGKEKTLAFQRSGYNGHIHAACLTDGCVRWME